MEIKQFVKHFRILFIITAIIVGIYITMLIVIKPKVTEVLRENNSTPGHRVFDTANVLSDSEEQMLEKLIAYLSKELDIPAEELDRDTTFESLHLDSLDTVEMLMDLEQELGVDLELEEKVATIGELADFIERKLD